MSVGNFVSISDPSSLGTSPNGGGNEPHTDKCRNSARSFTKGEETSSSWLSL